MKLKPTKSGLRNRAAASRVDSAASTHPHNQSEVKTGVNRSVSAGDHRGDRRDMSKTYSGTAKHASRGNSPRKDVSTRKR